MRLGCSAGGSRSRHCFFRESGKGSSCARPDSPFDFAQGKLGGCPYMSRNDREVLAGEEVVEGLDGAELIVFDVEDGVEAGDVENVEDFLSEVEEFEFSARLPDGGPTADELADAPTVNVGDFGEVQDDLLLVGGEEIAHRVAQGSGLIAEDNASGDVENRDGMDFAGCDLHAHSGNFDWREW